MLEESIMRGDAITRAETPPERRCTDLDASASQPLTELEEIYSPLGSIGDLSSSPIRNPILGYRLKVEGPLTPPNGLPPTTNSSKGISFEEPLQNVMEDLPPSIAAPENHPSSEADLAAFFEQSVRPLAEKVNRELAQEQLQEADSTKRVDVPVMDFSSPTPPWKVYLKTIRSGPYEDFQDELSRQMKLMGEIARTHLERSYWAGGVRIERQLRWTPFPLQLGKIATIERENDDAENEDATQLFLVGVSSKDNIDSSSLVWKPEGLRILKGLNEEHDDAGDDLEPGIFCDAKDITALVKKRRLQLNEEDDAPECTTERDDSYSARCVSLVVEMS